MKTLTRLLGISLLALGGCFAPPPQSQRVTEAARDMNLAARFGRVDIAAEHAANGARSSFLQRRAQWGATVRVLDVEISGLDMKDEHHAVVQVDISWVRADDDQLRSTRLTQSWSDRDGPWLLVREKRSAGDLGLFGERVPVVSTAHPDVHFKSKTIR